MLVPAAAAAAATLAAALLAGPARAAVTVDTSDKAAVTKAAAATARALMAFYPPNFRGAIPDVGTSDASGRQWFESGVMWGAFMEHARITGDGQFVPIVTNALSNVSYAPSGVGSYLGPSTSVASTLLGRWNDDIMWYALGSLTAAEVFGKAALMPRSAKITYLQATVNTYNEVMQQYDESSCNGGVFWSRDRTNPDNKDYKSTITNAQAILIAARLSILTGNKTYLTEADKIYAWLKGTQIITPTYHVYDGMSITKCQRHGLEYSYNAGILIGGMAWMYKATGNTNYITEAGKLLDTALTTFATGPVITDLCEGATDMCTVGDATSKPPAANQVPPKGTMIRGLTYLYMFTPDAAQKAKIKKFIDASFAGMLSTCTANMGCSAVWTPGAAPANGNFHHQLVAIELTNAVAAIYLGSSATADIKNPTSDVTTNVENSQTSTTNAAVGVAVVSSLSTLMIAAVAAATALML
nr:hydrolase 76 protein [Polyrhizophydium stewartii]